MSRNRSDRSLLYTSTPNPRGQLIPLRDLPAKNNEDVDRPYGSPPYNGTPNNNRNHSPDYRDSSESENLLSTRQTFLQASRGERNHPVEIDFKGQPAEELFSTVPTDRYKMVYIIIMLHGVGTLMPWNMFITANSYFSDYKLGNETVGPEGAQYRNDFLAYMGISAQLPNVLCNALNLFVQFGGSLTVRVVWSLFIEIVLFIFTIVLAMVDSSSWPGTFFWLTMACVVILNMAGGVYQNTVYGIASKLPMKYTNAVVLGSNISGTLTSIISIITLAGSPNLRTAAIYYFLTALLVLLACFDTYFALPLIRFYRYYEQKTAKSSDVTWSRPPYLKIFSKVWVQCLNVFAVFFVTLSIFPNIHADIKAVDPEFVIPQKYFSPVTCFLTFNFFAMVGNVIPNWFTWPGPKYIWIPIFLRFLFIPFYLFCNYNPTKRGDLIPLYIENDWIYFAVSIGLGITSGYFSSLAMMYAPRCVEAKHAPTAGMMAAFFLVLGIFCGVNFSLFLGKLLQGTLW